LAENLSEKRRAFLCEEPLLLGSSWARIWCEGVALEGRAVTGGWPGTLPEARVRVLTHLDRALLDRGMPSLSLNELSTATVSMYERAKRDWLMAARGAPPSASRSRAGGKQ
jgi:hypothetical protein